MAGKKGAAVQLQQDVSSDAEWEEMIKRTGLIVVDIYSGWCGPCVGMVGNLKKVKLEIGGDLLHLAIAKSDNITCLERFRNKSEPTWMFISNGKMVNLMFGANAPRLIRLMTEEIKKEGDFQRGLIDREGIPFDQLTPEEKEREEKEKMKEDLKKAESEAIRNEELEKRRQRIVRKLTKELKYDSVVLFLPFLYDKETQSWPAYQKLMDKLGMQYSAKKESLINLKMEDAEKLFAVHDEDFAEELEKQLEQGQCLVKMIGIPNPEEAANEPEVDDEFAEPVLDEPPPDEADEEGDEEAKQPVNVIEAVHYAIYGGRGTSVIAQDKEIPFDEDEEEDEEEGKEINLITNLFQEYAEITSVPALWAPANIKQMADAVIFLFPTYVEQMMGPEPPPPPPHLAVIFEAKKYPELVDTLQEFRLDVLDQGFFDSQDPEKAKRLGTTYNDFLLSKKSGNEKFVVMLNNSKSESVLALAQLGPTYVSMNPEEGKEECDKFFPPLDDEELERREKEIADDLARAEEVLKIPGFAKMDAPEQAMEMAVADAVELRPEAQAELMADAVLTAAVEGEPEGKVAAKEALDAAMEGKPGPAAEAVERAVAETTGEAPAADAVEAALAQTTGGGPAEEAVEDAIAQTTGGATAAEHQGVAEAVDKAVAESTGEAPPAEGGAAPPAEGGPASPEAKEGAAEAVDQAVAESTGDAPPADGGAAGDKPEDEQKPDKDPKEAAEGGETEGG